MSLFRIKDYKRHDNGLGRFSPTKQYFGIPLWQKGLLKQIAGAIIYQVLKNSFHILETESKHAYNGTAEAVTLTAQAKQLNTGGRNTLVS